MAAARTTTPDLVAEAGLAPAPDTSATAPAPAPTKQELESRAREYIAQEKFNRRFTLPATDAHDELTVTYAVGGVDSDTAPTVLFIGGMYGGRLLVSMTDHVGQSLGMRIVVIDRPGMGGSTIVDVGLRLSVWLETVPLLMRTINAQHVSIAAHSCGVIYALNTIYELPWILPPSNRKLYLFSPWVSLEHSGMTMLSISSYLPSPLINQFDNIVRFVNSTMMPAVHFSGIVSSALPVSSTADQEGGGSGDSGRTKPLPRHERDETCREYCGVSAAEYSARSKELMHAMFEESTRAANHEALLSLRKGVAGEWGVCDDYETYPNALEAKMREFSREIGGGTSRETGQSNLALTNNPFVIKAFWAEKDQMIEKKGEKYFNKCFERFSETNVGSSGDGNEHSYLLYESEVVPETTHDTVVLPQYEALPRALRDMLGRQE
ncbi:uncharacterized protein BCR38DRAFT_458026 [Pseudomassariella vexata]|uniref:AB hydrolase-1 domain-containing protein n=1 Tax=Pseudomassariella vexata TaxID=1141098 RepID=A0A1Y2DYY6_9PEZI|nr:uncharacterized protein BCR38DRAFT_458026 [Pseudomassariella vexata]ORY64304.1 hypothetical protein BCR38DRAFT_458026 [Pseudomassariella vexata]